MIEASSSQKAALAWAEPLRAFTVLIEVKLSGTSNFIVTLLESCPTWTDQPIMKKIDSFNMEIASMVRPMLSETL